MRKRLGERGADLTHTILRTPRTQAAMAGANIKIGGEREYRLHAEVWRAGKEIGDSERPCDWRDLVRARRLVDCAVWLLFGLATLGIASSWMVLR